MLPTQILLDQFYADNKHVTTNKSLKITKIQTTIHKRKPENISQETVPIISNKTSTKKTCSKNAKKNKGNKTKVNQKIKDRYSYSKKDTEKMYHT